MSGAEQVEKEILDWIESAEEPKDKAMLMILYRMNAGLVENTKFMQTVAQDFTDHKETINGHIVRVDRLLSMVKGGYFVAIIAVVLVQGLSLFIVNNTLNEMARQAMVNETQEHRLTVLETQQALIRNNQINDRVKQQRDYDGR